MNKTDLKNFGKPDEVREFPKGKLELIKVGGATVGRAIFEPRWRGRRRCSRSSKPKAARRRISSIT